MYKNKVVDVKGDKIEVYNKNCGAIGGKEVKRDAYAFTAPVTKGDQVDTVYAVCISNANSEKKK